MLKVKIVAGLALTVVVVLALQLAGVSWFRFLEPKKENARRAVFTETRSYNEAKAQDLARYRMQYMQAKTVEDKEAIASTIRIMYADYDVSKLKSVELRIFLNKINQFREDDIK